MAQVERTPVSVLQELTQHKHYPLPVYDLVDSQSGTHDNTFRIRVRVQDQYAIGVGKSKKEAKQLAAQILLEILTGRKHNFEPPKVVPNLASLPIGSQRNPIEQTKFYGFPQGMNEGKSAIAILHEMAQEKNYPLPTYNLVYSKSGTHENVFQYKVELKGQSAVGIGSSKKEAKHNASQNLLDLLNRKGKWETVNQSPLQSPQKTEKNSVDVLQELMAKLNDTLVYSQTYSKDNVFRYELKARDDFAIGVGKTSEEAKIDAARKFLDLLDSKGKQEIEKQQEACVLNPEDLWKVNHPLPPETNLVFQQNVSNAVAILQELLIRRNYPPPNYELVHSRTGTHSNMFFYKVEVLDDCAVGSGPSQKDAKHDAAQRMLQMLANKRKPQPSADTTSKEIPEIKSESDIQKCVTLDDAWKANKSLFEKININLPPVTEESTKTSIAILQELMAKQKNALPNYELVQCKSGTHENSFEYKVYADDECAIGVGKSKKEAKHNAAQRLLDLLADKGKYRQKTVQDYSPHLKVRSLDSINYSGSEIVQSLTPIAANNTKLPPWQEVSDRVRSPENINYSKSEVIQYVAPITVNNTKLFASEEVIDRIVDVLPELKEHCQKQDIEITDRDMEAQEKYNLLFAPQKMNLNTSVCDFDLQFKNAMKEKEIPIQTIQKYFKQPRSETTLQNLLTEFEYSYTIDEMQVDPIPISMLSINCDVPLSFMEMGNSMNEARTKVLDKAFTVLEAFMLA